MNSRRSKKNIKKTPRSPRRSGAISLQALKRTNQKLRPQILRQQQTGGTLPKNDQRWRAIFNNAPDGIIILNAATGVIEDVNSFLIQRLGYPRKKFLGKKLWKVGAFKDANKCKAAFLGLRKKKYIRYESMPLKTADGRPIDAEFISNIYHVDSQKVIQCNIRDVTDRKLAEEKLQKSEKRFRSIFESSHDAMMTLEPPFWKFASVNSAMVRMFAAKNQAELTFRSPWVLSPKRQPDGRASEEKAKEMIKTAMRKGVHFFEWTHKRINGEEFPAEVLLTRIETEEKIFLHAVVRDIAERKRIERDLRDTKERLEYVLGATKTGVDVIDAGFNLHYVNPSWQKMYGNPDGRKCYKYFMGRRTPCPGCGIPSALKTHKKIITEQTLVRENNRVVEVHTLPFKSKTGEWMAAEFNVDIDRRKKAEMEKELLLSLERATLESTADGILVVDHLGKITDFNERFVQLWRMPRGLLVSRDDGKILKYALRQLKDPKGFYKKVQWLYAHPEKDSFDILEFKDGRTIERYSHPQKVGSSTVGRVWSFRDVTAQKKVEAFRNEIIQTVSHELRTPLSIEKEGIKLLLDGVSGSLNAEQKDILETVMRNINRLSGMIDNLLDISHIEAGETKFFKKTVDLRKIVRNVFCEYKLKVMAKNIQLKECLPETSAVVFVDAAKIAQVLSNLIDNSLKFTKKGTITIAMRVLGKEVECKVQDTGCGLAPKYVDKMFEKFTQFLRPEGPGQKGLGLGLPISREIIERHGGRIWAQSKLGEGMRVTFTLPLEERKEPEG